MTIELSPRLLQVASYIPKNAKLCDVGSDHAYLPVYAMQQQLIVSAVAGEVVQGPFESANQTVHHYRMEDFITVRLGDGLEVVQPTDEITAVTICGMGGELIAQILERGLQGGYLQGKERLILQPNVAEHLVRQWLCQHDYQIQEEVVVCDHQRLYEVIVAEKVEQTVPLTPLQIQYGPYLLANPTEVVLQKWQRQLAKIEQILQQLQQSTTNQSEKIKKFTEEYQQLKEVIESANS